MAQSGGAVDGGANEEERDESGAKMIRELVALLESSAEIEDRRDALESLWSIANDMRRHVGTVGLKAFANILKQDQGHPEMIAATLDILGAVLNSEDATTDEDDLGQRFAQELMPSIPSVLAAAHQVDYSVRRAAIQLLTSLLRHRRSDVQHLLMQQAMGITRLIHLLREKREDIRNEAVLMLCELSRSNSQVQLLIATASAFGFLLDIVDAEPLDSTVIENCLFIMLNLLKKNAMNQLMFREKNLIPRLGIALQKFFDRKRADSEEGQQNGAVTALSTEDWPKQRTDNAIFLLQILRALVASGTAAGLTHAAQKAMQQAGILRELLCRVLTPDAAKGVGVELLTESVFAVAEIIRGKKANQEYFAAGEDGECVSLIAVVDCMSNEEQPLKLRAAAFHCLLACLHDNESTKETVLELLILITVIDHEALSSTDCVQSWFGCISLLHCLVGVDRLQLQLLQMQLGLAGNEKMDLLLHLTQRLISLGATRPQSRAALLQLLAVWLHDCPQAVAEFAIYEVLRHLATQIVDDECGEASESEQQVLQGLAAFVLLICSKNLEGTEATNLKDFLDRRVGRERMAGALEGMSRTAQFMRATQESPSLPTNPTELLLDAQFVKLFKAAEGELLQSLRPNGPPPPPPRTAASTSTCSNTEAVNQSYKDLIKRQAEEISALKQEAKESASEMEKLKKEADRSDLEIKLAETQAKLEQASISGEKTAALEAQIASLTLLNTQWRVEADQYKGWSQHLQHQLATLEQQLQQGYTAFEQQRQQMAAATAESEKWKEMSSQWEGVALQMERQWREEEKKKEGKEEANGRHNEDNASTASVSSTDVARLQTDC